MPGASHLSAVYRASWGNFTDLYQLTMALGYWQHGVAERPAVFHLQFRQHPFKGDFTLTAGLGLVIDYLKQWQFSVEEIQYLGSLRQADGQPLFTETFMHVLQRLRFTGSVYAVPEGTVMFPHTPVIRIEAPLLQAQLIETALLCFVNFSSLIATKAARMRRAAGQADTIMEFGLRRAQGPDGGLSASRAAYIGGADATSNVWAGQHLGIPVRGTHAHSWIMVFEDELEAFRNYAAALPGNCTFLVDTYDTIQGVKNAIEVGEELRAAGHRLIGIRLDSGNLLELGKKARQLLDEADMADVQIVASNDLDEYAIRDLKDQGSPITSWGLGTRLVTAFDQPALGGVYKLAALQDENGQWQPRVKLSEQSVKTSIPGRQQVRRFLNGAGKPVADSIYSPDIAPDWEGISTFHQVGQMPIPAHASAADLLIPIIEAGQLVYEIPSLAQVRAYAQEQLALFADVAPGYSFGLEPNLSDLREKMIRERRL